MDESQVFGHILSFTLFGVLAVQLCESVSVLAMDAIVTHANHLRYVHCRIPA